MSEEHKEAGFKNRPHHGPMGGHGPGGMGMPVEKPKNFKGSFFRLIGYLRPYLVNIIVVFVFAIASTVFAVWSPKVSGWAITNLTEGIMSKAVIHSIETMQEASSAAAKKKEDAFKAEIEKAQADIEKQKSEVVALGKELKSGQEDIKKTTAEIKKLQATLTAGQAAVKKTQALLTNQKTQMEDLQAQIAKDQSLLQSQMSSAAPDQAVILQLQQEMEKLGAQAKELGAAMQSEAAALEKKGAELKSAAAALKKKAESAQKEGSELKKKAALLEKKTDALKKAGTALQKKVNDAKAEAASMPTIASMKDAKTSAEKAKVFVSLVNTMKGLSNDQLATLRSMAGSSGASGISQVRNLSQKDIDSLAKAIRDTGGTINFAYIRRIVLWLILLYSFSAFCAFMQQFLMSSVAQNTVYHLRRDLDEKLGRLPLKYYDAHTHGDILSRMTNDIDTISTTLQQSITQVITAIVQILGYVIMMLTISPILTLIVLASLPLYVFVTMLVAKNSQKYFSAQQKELGDLSGHVEEMYTGHKIVKAFGYEQKSIDKFRDVNGRLYTAGWKAQFVSGIMFPMMNFISNISYVAIAVIGGIFVAKRRLELGDITAFIQYSRSFTMPIIQTANIANVIQSTIACAERVFEVLDEQEEIPDAADAKVLDHPRGDVKFEDVRFGYTKELTLMKDMNIDVRQGQTIAIVGPTGAGKTTIVNLLMRFYEIDGGRITVDGVDIRHIARPSLRATFGMVLQDTWLFNGTIRENIAYGKDGAGEEKIVTAAKVAHADHFIRTLPDGYDTVLNEEASNISQGQKQLLTIARAFLADPAILILDEATSSVDTRTEILIQKAMSVLMKGRTNFVIAHRLSTIRDAEMILVMNHGSIVEKGTHGELMALNGFYADLYNSQFTGAAVAEDAM